jgi:hypothetical protein
MALQVHQFIDDFRKKTLEYSILTELSYIQKEALDETKERESLLVKLLDEINEKSKIKSDTTQELKDMFDNIEQQMHMQPWNKLQDSYKIEKINEYCQINKLDDSINKQLIKLINEKYLTSKYILYNQMKQYIDEITLIIKDENNNLILDNDKIKKMISAKTKTKTINTLKLKKK